MDKGVLIGKLFSVSEYSELLKLHKNIDINLIDTRSVAKVAGKVVVEHLKFECSGRSIFTILENDALVIVWLGVGFIEHDLGLSFSDEYELLHQIGFYTVNMKDNINIKYSTIKLDSGIVVWYTHNGGIKEIINIIEPKLNNKPLDNTQECDGGGKQLGMKFDDDKLLCMAFPAFEQKQILEVLTNGAKKYKVDNWKHVENARIRYMNGLERHFLDYKEAIQTGNNELKFDNGEGGMGTNHLANLICNALFLLYFDNNNID